MRFDMRSSRYLIAVLFAVFAGLLFSCKDDPVLTASQQAEVYYAMLLNGQYEDFVRGSYGCDSLPQDYLSQRVDLLAQHVKKEQAKRKGYLRVKALEDHLLADSTHLIYLDVLFGDSTHETIACPMIRDGQRWVMRN